MFLCICLGNFSLSAIVAPCLQKQNSPNQGVYGAIKNIVYFLKTQSL